MGLGENTSDKSRDDDDDADKPFPLLSSFRRFLRRSAKTRGHIRRLIVDRGDVEGAIGTAVGVCLEVRDCEIVCMPGVPRELTRMMREEAEPRLRQRFTSAELPRRTYRCLGRGESSLAAQVEPALEGLRREHPDLGPLYVHYRASMPEVQVTIEALPGPDGRRVSQEALAELTDARERLAEEHARLA